MKHVDLIRSIPVLQKAIPSEWFGTDTLPWVRLRIMAAQGYLS